MAIPAALLSVVTEITPAPIPAAAAGEIAARVLGDGAVEVAEAAGVAADSVAAVSGVADAVSQGWLVS